MAPEDGLSNWTVSETLPAAWHQSLPDSKGEDELLEVPKGSKRIQKASLVQREIALMLEPCGKAEQEQLLLLGDGLLKLWPGRSINASVEPRRRHPECEESCVESLAVLQKPLEKPLRRRLESSHLHKVPTEMRMGRSADETESSGFVLPAHCAWLQGDVFAPSRIQELRPAEGFQVVVLDPPWESKSRGRSSGSKIYVHL